MATTPTIYSITEGAQTGQLDVVSIWGQQGSAPMPTGFKFLFPVTVSGDQFVIGTDATNKGSAFKIDVENKQVTAAASAISFKGQIDNIVPLVLGNLPYLMTYSTAKGIFNIYPLNTDLSLGKPFEYYRNHDPGITAGFTTIAPFNIFGAMYYIGYSFSTGKVCIYSLDVISATTDGTPPLSSNIVWAHTWAKDWTRFAFFQLGGENFFLKTNVGKPNVNIDHIVDDPTQGTVEVGTLLTLPNELTLNIVTAFYIGPNPYFITYQNDGTTTFYRFNGDCKGWQLQASANTIMQAGQIVTFNAGGGSYALFY